jgi:hypothetical protein
MGRLKLTISDWQNGIWGNRVLFFKNLQEAKEELRRQKGRVKIYNEKNQVIFSEKIPEINTYSSEN